MASTALRLRRALSFSSTLISRSTVTASSTAAISHSPILHFPYSSPPPPSSSNSFPPIGSRSVHSTSLSLSASRSFNHGDEQIDENTILFEGCDYKHWLITMDFPKDPRPSPEEMVETYVQTLAKVVGSVEEAKKRMYACSTTTYTGFQAEMDEETANKFESLPGVVFVLPDSYIDPVNKEYGGDKYVNGTIIPRPPPIQYGRQRRPRDPPQQNYGPPQQNYGPPQQNYPPRQNFAPPQNYAPPQQNYAPPQQNFAPPQGERMGPPPPYNQGPQQGFAPPGQGAPYNQGGGYPPRNPTDYGNSQGLSEAGRQNFAPPSFSRGPEYGGQGVRGPYGQNPAAHFENGAGGSYGQGTNPEYGQGYAARGESRPFNPPPGEQNIGGQGQQRNYPPMGRD